jgi:hypothetical protein
MALLDVAYNRAGYTVLCAYYCRVPVQLSPDSAAAHIFIASSLSSRLRNDGLFLRVLAHSLSDDDSAPPSYVSASSRPAAVLEILPRQDAA